MPAQLVLVLSLSQFYFFHSSVVSFVATAVQFEHNKVINTNVAFSFFLFSFPFPVTVCVA